MKIKRAVILLLCCHGSMSFAFNPGHLQQLYDNKFCYGCDLVGANLQNWDLTGMNLAGSDLSYANLRGATLSNTNLSGANLSGAIWINGSTCKVGSVGSCQP